MTNSEIQGLFRCAKYPRKQIQIISQLSGKSEKEVSEIVGYALPQAKTKPPRLRKPWSEKETENLCTAYGCGVKAAVIAKMIDRPVSAVKSKICELKIKGIIKEGV